MASSEIMLVFFCGEFKILTPPYPEMVAMEILATKPTDKVDLVKEVAYYRAAISRAFQQAQPEEPQARDAAFLGILETFPAETVVHGDLLELWEKDVADAANMLSLGQPLVFG